MCIYGLVMVTQIQQFYVCYLCGSIDVAKHFHPSAPPGRSFGAWELARPCECSGILATFGAKQTQNVKINNMGLRIAPPRSLLTHKPTAAH